MPITIDNAHLALRRIIRTILMLIVLRGEGRANLFA